ncbi:hypothetical protein ABFS82_02G064600 [Erythranthe guttata]
MLLSLLSLSLEKQATHTQSEREHCRVKVKVAYTKVVATSAVVVVGLPTSLSLFPNFFLFHLIKQKKNDLQTHHRHRRLHNNPIFRRRRRRRQRHPPPLLPSGLVILFVRRLLPRLLLLSLPPLLLPRTPRRRRNPRRRPRRETEKAGIQPPAGGRAVHGHQPHHGLLRHRVPRHPDGVHRRQRQQGRDQVQGVQVHYHVPRHTPREGYGSGVRSGGPHRETDRDRHRRRPRQLASGGCRRFGQRCLLERPGRTPGRRRCRGEDTGHGFHLTWCRGIGGLYTSHQSKKAILNIQAVWIRWPHRMTTTW